MCAQAESDTHGQFIFLKILGPVVVALALHEHSELEVDVRDQFRAEVGFLLLLPIHRLLHLVAAVLVIRVVAHQQLRQRQLVLLAHQTVHVSLQVLEVQLQRLERNQLAIPYFLILLVGRLQQCVQPGEGDSLFVDCFEEVGAFGLVLEQQSHVVVVAAHEEPVHAAEGRFAAQEEDVQVSRVVQQLRRRNAHLVPKIMAAAELGTGLQQTRHAQTGVATQVVVLHADVC